MNLRHRAFTASGLLCALLLAAAPASAQSIEDRLRSQLRETTEQLRQLQDDQSHWQADKAGAEQQRDKALADLKQAQADLAAAKGKSQGEVDAEHALAEEKNSHAQDDQQLARYKSQYEDLLKQSKSRDALAQEGLKTRDTQLQTCESKNIQLYQVGHDILDAYEHAGISSYFKSRQPFAQAARVKYDTIAQTYGDQLYGAKYDPNAKPPAKASAPTPPAK